MAFSVLGCLILEMDTGMILFAHFFDEELRLNQSSVPQMLKSGKIKMITEVGKHQVYAALVRDEGPEVRPFLEGVRDRIETAYPDGMKRGTGDTKDLRFLRMMMTAQKLAATKKKAK